jgi:hypothetical protein
MPSLDPPMIFTGRKKQTGKANSPETIRCVLIVLHDPKTQESTEAIKPKRYLV